MFSRKDLIPSEVVFDQLSKEEYYNRYSICQSSVGGLAQRKSDQFFDTATATYSTVHSDTFNTNTTNNLDDFEMFSKNNKNLKKISFSLIASALFYVSILSHSKLFKSSSSSSSTNLALLAKTAASTMGAAGAASSSSSSGSHSSSTASGSCKSSSRLTKKLFEQMSPTFTMIFLIFFYCFCSLCLVVNVNAQENIYYYTDGDGKSFRKTKFQYINNYRSIDFSK